MMSVTMKVEKEREREIRQKRKTNYKLSAFI